MVTNKEKIEQLSMSSPYSGCAKGAAVVFVACYQTECMRPEYAQIDMSASVENLLLEIDNQGLGAVWIGIAPIKERMEKVAKIMEMPESLTAFALIACGYPAEERPQQDRYEEERVHYCK